MEYTVNKLAKLSGVSTRTLRYYDEIGLLKPCRIASNGYRIYGEHEVNLLQQILFYRELGVQLEDIGRILAAPEFDREKALEGHLSALLQRKNQLDVLIQNVTKTIQSLKGETTMSNKEKFEGFKKKLIDDNEKTYGKEIREKYGNDTVDESNRKLAGMSEEQWKHQEELSVRISELLAEAVAAGDPACAAAQEACALHKEWLCMFWKEGMYSKEAHMGLGEMYVADERFKAHYDAIAPGCAELLRDALIIYCSDNE